MIPFLKISNLGVTWLHGSGSGTLYEVAVSHHLGLRSSKTPTQLQNMLSRVLTCLLADLFSFLAVTETSVLLHLSFSMWVSGNQTKVGIIGGEDHWGGQLLAFAKVQSNTYPRVGFLNPDTVGIFRLENSSSCVIIL